MCITRCRTPSPCARDDFIQLMINRMKLSSSLFVFRLTLTAPVINFRTSRNSGRPRLQKEIGRQHNANVKVYLPDKTSTLHLPICPIQTPTLHSLPTNLSPSALHATTFSTHNPPNSSFPFPLTILLSIPLNPLSARTNFPNPTTLPQCASGNHCILPRRPSDPRGNPRQNASIGPSALFDHSRNAWS